MSKAVLPNLIVAGVNKGGTTSLFSYLSKHKDICSSSKKETCYFLPLRYGDSLAPIEQYAQYFKHYSQQKYVMESTPGYFYGGKTVAKAIKESLEDVKIIIIFRDPIERLFSFYKFQKSMMNIDKDITFDDYVNISESLPELEARKQKNNKYWGVRGGFYSDYLEDWFQVFDDSVKIVFFEQLKNQPTLLLKEIGEWLSLDESIFDSVTLSIENKTVNYNNNLLHRIALLINTKGEKFLRAYPQLKQTVRKIYYALNGKPHTEAIPEYTLAYLKSVYNPYNKQLVSQLSLRGYTDFPNWLHE